MIKIPRLCWMSSWGGGANNLAKTHCFDISRMLLPQDLVFVLSAFPGIAGLAPTWAGLFQTPSEHKPLFMFLPSFLIDLTLLYFSLFHLQLPYFSHVLYPGVFQCAGSTISKALACLFTPPQENGLIYLIGLLGKNKMGVLAHCSLFFFSLGGVSPSKAGERTCSNLCLCDSV